MTRFCFNLGFLFYTKCIKGEKWLLGYCQRSSFNLYIQKNPTVRIYCLHMPIKVNWQTCCFFFFGLLFRRGLWASELELKLLLWPVREFEFPPFPNEDLLLLSDLDGSILDPDIFLLDELPSLGWPGIDLDNELVGGRGGGIRARAEICLCKIRVIRYKKGIQ